MAAPPFGTPKLHYAGLMSTTEDRARERLLNLVEGLTEDMESPTAQLVTAGMLQDLLPGVMQELVDSARSRGASWQDVATARHWKTPGSAYWHYGKGRTAGADSSATKEDRLQAARGRAAEARAEKPPAPELPGLSRQDAAAQLRCDPKTLVRRAERLDGVRVEEVPSGNGKTVRRYFIL